MKPAPESLAAAVATKPEDVPRSRLKLAVAALGLFWVLGAALLPAVQDEAYYFSWARALDFGYFDHPPLVALIGLTSRLAPGHVFVARLGTLAVAALTVWAALRFFRELGLGRGRRRTAAFLLAFGNVLGLVAGFVTTPDTVLMLAWVLALGEAAAALRHDPRRWLTAGLATGVGLLGKYTMVLIGPVFLWALVHDLLKGLRPRPALKTPWPYLGGTLALLVFLPNLWWNAQHNWITMTFQLRHGLALERSAMVADDALPKPEKAALGSPEARLGQEFAALERKQKKEELKPGPLGRQLAALNRYVGYYASQIALWGALLWTLWPAIRRRWRAGASAAATVGLSDTVRPLAVAATVVPLLVFGAFSLGAKVEANWSAMYVFGAAALLAPLVAGNLRRLVIGGLVNALLLGVLLVHARTGFLPTRPHQDRVLAETHGYAALAHHVATLDAPVFADSYQITAMMRFYEPTLDVQQWPGITRDSEYVRRPEWATARLSNLRLYGWFWLITTDDVPPHFSGFSATEMTQLRDCKDEGLQVISSLAAQQVERRCKKPIHEWYLVRYGAIPSGAN